jgi:UDP-N-acetylmuramyl pentapeptide synthase
VFDRNINTGMFNLSKRRFAKTLGENGIVEGIERIYGRLRTLERINQKLVFNELYNSNPGFLKEEIEFLRQFSNIKTAMTYRKQILNYVKESENDKISNYL